MYTETKINSLNYENSIANEAFELVKSLDFSIRQIS